MTDDKVQIAYGKPKTAAMVAALAAYHAKAQDDNYDWGICRCLGWGETKVVSNRGIWVDAGYSGENFARVVQQICGVRVEVIKRIAKTFEILPKRWLVERTFGWLNRYRRLSKDYKLHSENSEAMIYGSLIRLMTRRLAAA